MTLGPVVVLNGYPGVGKAAIASTLRELIPNSKYFDNHLLIDPAAALLERDDVGYRDLRKALRTPVLNCIAENPALQQRTVITTYYQETFNDGRDIDLEEFYESAKKSRRCFIVFILRCSEKENIRRFSSRASGSKSKLTDVTILEDILRNHKIYSFRTAGFRRPDVWEDELDIDDMEPDGVAYIIRSRVENIMSRITGNKTETEEMHLPKRIDNTNVDA